MTTPGRDSLPSPEPDAATIELRQRIIEETRKRTHGKTPYEWQIQNTIDRLSGKDTFVIAGTGAGKSLTFAMVPFIIPKSITWILAPLNYIEEQLVKELDGWGVKAVAINQNTNWEVEKRKILQGKYQVVISSPEAFLSVDRLRTVVMSPELAEYEQFGVVDEAHVIHTWGSKFRKDYGRVGNLRGMMFDIVFSAVTATATPAIKQSIIDCLHLGTQRELAEINLGNFRSNIEYSTYLMKGGSESYEELLEFFRDRDKLRPTIIFVDKTHDTHAIATLLRDHLGITGTPDWDLVRPYHANRAQSGKDQCAEDFNNGKCMILISTEALTMGANFLRVELVIQFPAPNSLVTHVQRIGRGARSPNVRCQGIMMVTPHQYQRAVKLCANVDDMKPDDLLNAKVEEEDLDELEGVLGNEETQLAEDSNTLDEPGNTEPKKTPKTGLRAINLHVARFITTKTCRIKVLDDIFKNPEHISCYEAGTCDLCVARRARDEAAAELDTHTQDRAVKREEIEVELDARGEEAEEPKRKRASRVDNRTGKELQRFVDELKQWRRKTFKIEAETRYIGIEDVMTDKAMGAIAKCKSIQDLLSLDHLEPVWPQRARWREEVVKVVLDLVQTIEDKKWKAAEEEQQRKEEERKEREARKKADKGAREADKEARKLARQQGRKAKQTAGGAPQNSQVTFNNPPRQPSPPEIPLVGPNGSAVVAQTPARVVIGLDGRHRAIIQAQGPPTTPTSRQTNPAAPRQQLPTPHTPAQPQPPPFARPMAYSAPDPPPPSYSSRPLPFAYGAPYVTPRSAPRVPPPFVAPQPGPSHQPHPNQIDQSLTGHQYTYPYAYSGHSAHTPHNPAAGNSQNNYQHNPLNNTYRIPAPQFQPLAQPPPPPAPYWPPYHPPSQ